MTYASQVRAKIAARRAKRERAARWVAIGQWSAMGFLAISALFFVGSLAACYGHYMANFGAFAG